MSAKPRILIIDDHAVVRAGCRLLLQQGGHTAIIQERAARKGWSSTRIGSLNLSFSIWD